MRPSTRFRLQCLINTIQTMYSQSTVEWDEEDKFYSITLADETVILIYNDEESIDEETS